MGLIGISRMISVFILLIPIESRIVFPIFLYIILIKLEQFLNYTKSLHSFYTRLRKNFVFSDNIKQTLLFGGIG